MSILSESRVGTELLVDQEVLESVLNSDPDSITQTGFVRLFYGESEPEVNEDSKESVDLDEELVPLEGCTQEDVGWMRVSYGEVQGIGGQSGVCIQPPESNWRLYANITE